MRISAEQFGVWCRTIDPKTCPTYDPFDMRPSTTQESEDRMRRHKQNFEQLYRTGACNAPREILMDMFS